MFNKNKSEHNKNCCHEKGCALKIISKVLVVVGALNWGLIGLGMLLGKTVDVWNLVHKIFGSMGSVEAIIYVLVGVAAVMKIFGCKCPKCLSGTCSMGDKITEKEEKTS